MCACVCVAAAAVEGRETVWGGLVSPAPQCLDKLGQQGGDEGSAERRQDVG